MLIFVTIKKYYAYLTEKKNTFNQMLGIFALRRVTNMFWITEKSNRISLVKGVVILMNIIILFKIWKEHTGTSHYSEKCYEVFWRCFFYGIKLRRWVSKQMGVNIVMSKVRHSLGSLDHDTELDNFTYVVHFVVVIVAFLIPHRQWMALLCIYILSNICRDFL